MKRAHMMFLFTIFVLIIAILSSCGGGGGGGESIPPNEPEPSIDLSGVWAGTWSGKDPVEGDVHGHWEAVVNQNNRNVNGSFVLSGDVDCPEGVLAGFADDNDLFSGTILRLPCQQNEWELKAVNLDDRSASGTWDQVGSGASGTFTGIQVATPGGPRIAFFHPQGGSAGTIVTVVGDHYAATETDNRLKFGDTTASAVDLGGTSKLVTTVPITASSGPISLETPAGVAISPSHFMTNVTSPAQFVSKEIRLSRSQVGVAVNPNGRRIYFAANHQDPSWGGLMMVDVTSQEVLSVTPVSASTDVTLQGVAVSPDGRRVYVACDSFGVCVFDAINNTLNTTLPVAAGPGGDPNPQGLALSPDGQLLYVADNRDGGAVTVVETNTYQPVASISFPAGLTPQGVAAHPDGHVAYFVFSAPSGQNGFVMVYDVAGQGIVDTIEVGAGPIGIAVTADGRTIYVSNALENTVDVIDAGSHAILWTVPVSAGPTGVAISPDGESVYVACRYSSLVTILSVQSPQVSSRLAVSPEPLHVTFTPDGKRAYVTHASIGLSEEIGGSMVLSVAKAGSGSGIVRSSPGTIECGTSCQGLFDKGTIVTLAATPDNGSSFTGWDGTPDCLDGVVSMDTNKDCVAVFNSVPPETDNGTHVYAKCFIATAAYGSYLDPHVQVLRDFRDDVLLKNTLGQMFVDYYYEYSPPIAAKIAENEGLKAATRIALTPLVFTIEYPLGSIMLVILVSVFIGRRILRTWSKPL
jgi:YVTN family beta-propeller protein